MGVRLAPGESVVLHKTDKPSVITRSPAGDLVQVTQDTVNLYNRSAANVLKRISRGVEDGTLSSRDIRILESHVRLYRSIARHYDEALNRSED